MKQHSLLCLVLFFAAACGVKGAPLPPIGTPDQPERPRVKTSADSGSNSSTKVSK